MVPKSRGQEGPKTMRGSGLRLGDGGKKLSSTTVGWRGELLLLDSLEISRTEGQVLQRTRKGKERTWTKLG